MLRKIVTNSLPTLDNQNIDEFNIKSKINLNNLELKMSKSIKFDKEFAAISNNKS